MSSVVVLRTARCKTLQDLTDTETDTPAGNPHPPEPHSGRKLGQIRQNVAFTRCFGHRCRIWERFNRPHVARNSQQNSQLGPTHPRLVRRQYGCTRCRKEHETRERKNHSTMSKILVRQPTPPDSVQTADSLAERRTARYPEAKPTVGSLIGIPTPLAETPATS